MITTLRRETSLFCIIILFYMDINIIPVVFIQPYSVVPPISCIVWIQDVNLGLASV